MVQSWFTVFLHPRYWRCRIWCKYKSAAQQTTQQAGVSAVKPCLPSPPCLCYAGYLYSSEVNHTCSLGPLKLMQIVHLRWTKHNICTMSSPPYSFQVSCACTTEVELHTISELLVPLPELIHSGAGKSNRPYIQWNLIDTIFTGAGKFIIQKSY